MQKNLTNIVSSVEDLRIAIVKIDEIQELINEEKAKNTNILKCLQPLGEILY